MAANVTDAQSCIEGVQFGPEEDSRSTPHSVNQGCFGLPERRTEAGCDIAGCLPFLPADFRMGVEEDSIGRYLVN